MLQTDQTLLSLPGVLLLGGNRLPGDRQTRGKNSRLSRPGGDRMADFDQIRAACEGLMRSSGLAAVTIVAVSQELRSLGVSPGSKKNLSVLVRRFKAMSAKTPRTGS
jgi:hypothetical protein